MQPEQPQFPIKGGHWVNQEYDENQAHYSTGHHGALDIIPYAAGNTPYPADIYPVFSGMTLSVQNTDKDRGKGIRVRTEIWPDLADYLTTQGVQTGVYLECLYWHLLEVTDLDGQIDQQTPVGKAGNTGDVWSSQFPGAQGLQPVPPQYKGVPPYYGLHLHLEMRTTDINGKPLNLNLDPYGRFNPRIILNYKPQMTKRYIIRDGNKLGVLTIEGFTGNVAFADTIENWDDLKKALHLPQDAKEITLPQ